MNFDTLATSYVELNKSKFFGYLVSINEESILKEILKDLAKEHKKAKHIVYAYKIGMKSKSTDNGEPKGSAGHPLLELLYKKNLDNVAIIVVRYYGGTNLGASRLLRCYLQTGIDCVDSYLGKEK